MRMRHCGEFPDSLRRQQPQLTTISTPTP